MPNVARSLEGTIAWCAGRIGWSWPNDWWPGQTNAVDDCAAFVSAALYGLRPNSAPVFTYVSQLQNNLAYGQRFYSRSGVRRGDVIGFSWGMNDEYDHTEIALDSPNSGGFFNTIGTNATPGDDVRVRSRNTKYILSYFRPNYPGTTPADVPASPATTIGDELSAAEVQELKDYIRMVVTRERARLYFDAGADGKTPESASHRAVAAEVESGFIYPLSSDPETRAGQLGSLRTSGYQLIGDQERWVGLNTARFNNMLEMANGHLRRIAAEVVRQQQGGETPPTTSTVPRGVAAPTPALD